MRSDRSSWLLQLIFTHPTVCPDRTASPDSCNPHWLGDWNRWFLWLTKLLLQWNALASGLLLALHFETARLWDHRHNNTIYQTSSLEHNKMQLVDQSVIQSIRPLLETENHRSWSQLTTSYEVFTYRGKGTPSQINRVRRHNWMPHQRQNSSAANCFVWRFTWSIIETSNFPGVSRLICGLLRLGKSWLDAAFPRPLPDGLRNAESSWFSFRTWLDLFDSSIRNFRKKITTVKR